MTDQPPSTGLKPRSAEWMRGWHSALSTASLVAETELSRVWREDQDAKICLAVLHRVGDAIRGIPLPPGQLAVEQHPGGLTSRVYEWLEQTLGLGASDRDEAASLGRTTPPRPALKQIIDDTRPPASPEPQYASPGLQQSVAAAAHLLDEAVAAMRSEPLVPGDPGYRTEPAPEAAVALARAELQGLRVEAALDRVEIALRAMEPVLKQAATAASVLDEPPAAPTGVAPPHGAA